MRASLLTAVVAALLLTAPAHAQLSPSQQPGFVPSDANAGATPTDDSVYRAFGEQAGIERVVTRLVALYKIDPRLEPIFAAADDVRLRELLIEQFCYITGGPCRYTGADMKSAHADMGLQTADFNALVENLQTAMDENKVPFSAQNRLLAKLAPMKRDVVTR